MELFNNKGKAYHMLRKGLGITLDPLREIYLNLRNPP